MNEIIIQRITKSDDLEKLAADVIGSEWGTDNEMQNYDEGALREYISREDNVLLVAYSGTRPVGLSLATKILRPYGTHWLYVDEVDVHPDFRRRSIGRKLMQELIVIAKKWNLKELWLGTEPDNEAANHLYKSLKPSEVEPFIGYLYMLEDHE